MAEPQNLNPIQLPPRFAIRKLEPKHKSWAQAIITHSNIFHSPIWSRLYLDNQAERAYRMHAACSHMFDLNIASGYSYGVFDTEYQFKHPASAAAGGQLLWDPADLSATGEQLLAQMDFPLVAIAMAYDEGEDRPVDRWVPLFEIMPRFVTMFEAFGAGDKRDPASWKPKGLGEVLEREGTSTRADYEGLGLGKGMAHWLMFEVKRLGFRGIQVAAAHPAVLKIFMNPPEPFTAELIHQFNSATYEVEEDGVKVKPFAAAGDESCSLIYVTLK